jgi:hypothetical protein
MIPIHHYLNVRNAYFGGFSGGGTWIVFVSDLSGVPQVWQVPAEAGPHPWWPEQLTFAGERVQGVWPAPGGDLAIYERDVGGDEKAQLFLLDTARGGERALTAGHEAPCTTSAAGLRMGDVLLLRQPARSRPFRPLPAGPRRRSGDAALGERRAGLSAQTGTASR